MLAMQRPGTTSLSLSPLPAVPRACQWSYWSGFGLAAVRSCSVPSLSGWGGKSERKINI